MMPRGHFKSTIITFGRSIQEIIRTHGEGSNHKEHCIGIFSCTRPLSVQFLREIKTEIETNILLQELFPDIFYTNPQREAITWSEQNGLILKRKRNRKEATLEAWGIVEGQPTSKHFDLCIGDDILTHEMALTKYSLDKVTESWKQAQALITREGKWLYAGTRKSFGDVYSYMIDKNIVQSVIYSTHDDEGNPYYLTEEEIQGWKKKMGPRVFASEMEQNPMKDSISAFDITNLMSHEIKDLSKLTLFMVCDPANKKKKTSDYTAMVIFGVDAGGNILIIDGIRDRLNTKERWLALYMLYKEYSDHLKWIYYEQVGLAIDLDYYKLKMDIEGWYFDHLFIELCPSIPKTERINSIDGFIIEKKLRVPLKLPKRTILGEFYDFIASFINDEFIHYPFSAHDDILDCVATAVGLVLSGDVAAPSNRQTAFDDYLAATKVTNASLTAYERY